MALMVIAVVSDKDTKIDVLYEVAVAFVLTSRRASISAVQRKLKIGYNRAASMIKTMERLTLLLQ